MKGDFPGLLGVVNAYLNSLNVEFDKKRKLRKYLDLVKRRSDGMRITLFFFVDASLTDPHSHLGSLVTTAGWIRNFVRSHPAYKFDSVVSQEINYDLICAIDDM
jgi:glutamate--cysteine ligase catalytic subunit